MSQINGGGGSSTDPLILAVTTATIGQIQQPAGTRLLHTFGVTNLFLGSLAGNFTLSGADRNIGIGPNSLLGLTNGDDNVAVGTDAGIGITTGTSNSMLGNYAGKGQTTGVSNTLLGYYAGGSGDNTASAAVSNNTYVGYQAGHQSAGAVSGGSNVAIGLQARYNSTAISTVCIGVGAGLGIIGAGSIAIGRLCLDSTTAGADQNIAIGYQASTSLSSATNTTVLGHNAASSLTTGSDNTLIGCEVFYANSTGAFNAYVGSRAGGSGDFTSSAGCSNNAYLGYRAAYRAVGANVGSDNVVIGYQARVESSTLKTVCIGSGAGANLIGNGSIAIGYQALDANTAGADRNTALGYTAATNLTSGTDSTIIGYEAGLNISIGSGNTLVGSEVAKAQTSGTRNTMMGYYAGGSGNGTASAGLDDNTYLGYQAGYQTTGAVSGGGNVAIGKGARTDSTSSDSVCIGQDAGKGLIGSTSIAIGKQALDGTVAGAQDNVAIGYQAATGAVSAASITVVGKFAGKDITAANHSTFFGYATGLGLTTSGLNTLIGSQAGGNNNSTLSSGITENVYVGYQAGYAGAVAVVGSNNVGIGSQARYISSTTGATCVGYNAGKSLVGNGSVAIGFQTLFATIAGAANNTAVGYKAGTALTTATDCTMLGHEAALSLTTGIANTFLGRYTGLGQTTGASNTLVGFQAGASINSTASAGINSNTYIGYNSGAMLAAAVAGASNTALGYQAKYNSTAANTVCIGYNAGAGIIGDGSVAIGYQTLNNTAAGAANNVAIGYTAGSAVTTGTGNVFVGDSAGSNNTTGGKNTFLGYAVSGSVAGRTGSIGIGYGCSPAADYVGVFGANGGVGNAAGELNGIGVGTTNPTSYFSVYEKIGHSKEGALLRKLTNKTGANSVTGSVVSLATGTDDAFILSPIDDLMPIGVVYTAGVADGSECWVAISGRAQVDCANAASRGAGILRVCATGDAGAAAGKATADTVPITGTHHDAEIGHPMRTIAGAGLVWAELHFR